MLLRRTSKATVFILLVVIGVVNTFLKKLL